MALGASVDSGVAAAAATTAVGGLVRRRRTVVLDGASPPLLSAPLGLVFAAAGCSGAASGVARLRPRRPTAGAGVVGLASNEARAAAEGDGGGGRSGSAHIVGGVRKCGAPICLHQMT